MADPKLVLETEPDDLVLESIAPEPDRSEAGPKVALPPPPTLGSAPGAAKPSLGSAPRVAGAPPSAPALRPPGPPLPLPKAPPVGPLPPPPAPSNTKLEKPPGPTRASPPIGARPPPMELRRPVAGSNQETIPAPARDGSAKWRVPSTNNERSSVTSREPVAPASVAGGGTSPRLPPPPVLPATNPSLPSLTTPARVSAASLGSGSVGAGSVRSSGGGTSVGALPGNAIAASVTSGQFNLKSGSGRHAQPTYREQSALMRLMSPFIEDPRPRWLLATYFLVGVALGIGAAFGLWGQH